MTRPAALVHPAGVPRRQPVHPGRFLERHFLKPLALSQSEAARRLGISRRRINELVLGQRAMSPDTAIRCALAFGLPAVHWLAMQADWDVYHAWRQLRVQAQPPRPALDAPPAAATAASARALPEFAAAC